MRALRYLFARLLYTLPVLWLVVSVVFLLIHLVPGDPILQMLGEGAPVTDVAATRHAYGLDSWRRLEWIGRIYDQNPISMAQERHSSIDLCFPSGACGGLSGLRNRSRKQQSEQDESSAHIETILPKGDWTKRILIVLCESIIPV